MDDIKVITNFALKGRQFGTYAKRLGSKIMRDGMFLALEMIGNAAVANHMKQTSIDDFATALSGNKLRIRSGRLSRSIMGIMSFTTSKYPAKMERFIKTQIPTSKEGWSGGKKESIRRVTVSGRKVEGIIGSEVPYAAIHEYGGKAGRNKSVTIPKRPYIKPAIKEEMPNIHKMFNEFIHTTFAQEGI